MGEGWPLSLPFRVVPAASTASEITVGGVWGPAIVESLSLEVELGFVTVRGFAMSNRVPLRTGLAVGGLVSADPLFVTAVDAAAGVSPTGYVALGAAARLVEIGRLVTWGPWWLVLVVESAAAAVQNVQGLFKLRVLEHEGHVAVPRVEREVAVGAGYGRVGGRNPHGLVAGYRSWV